MSGAAILLIFVGVLVLAARVFLRARSATLNPSDAQPRRGGLPRKDGTGHSSQGRRWRRER